VKSQIEPEIPKSLNLKDLNTMTTTTNTTSPFHAWAQQLQESFDALWNSFVDPAESLYDVDGTRWNALGGGLPGGRGGLPFVDEAQLAALRDECRALAVFNEFAVNGHENRISYIVGSGHHYRVTPHKSRATGSAGAASEELLQQVQAVLDEFVAINQWHKRQQEIVRRKDRDGECFIRFFPAADGTLRVRFVEPDQVAAPQNRIGDPAAAFGIQCDPDDVETVLGYWIDGRFVDASEIQHRKANVDANVKRGLPLFTPVRKNLRRAEKLLRNMSVVSEIQSAIAIIRKHRAATGAGLEQFVASQADATAVNPATGRTTHFRRFAPGTILDALADTEYEFPASGIDAGRYVTVLQAELRAIASRLVMPEFMLTSDASNANYSSTMVAEGPAVKMFERLQHEMIEDDLAVMRRVLAHAAASGRLPYETVSSVEIRGIPPTLAVRDRLRDAQADQILLKSGAMSVQTLALRHGLDPEHEQQLLAIPKDQ
jgi:capsid protein